MKVQSDYLLTYTNSWGDHSVTATAGFTTYYNKLENLNGARTQGVGLVIPDNPDKWYVSIGDAATATNGSTQWERSTVSVLARVLYNYKGKYLFNGSYRRDGSSAFSYTGNQWQNFYSVGLGWLMSEEAWMKDITWLDMLKLKGSWGTLGNQNLDRAYPAEPLLTNAYSAVFGTPSAIYPGYQLSYLPNPNLRWRRWKPGKPVQKPTSSATACTLKGCTTRRRPKTCSPKCRASRAPYRASATSAPSRIRAWSLP